jgi:hypothetical protein
MTENGKSNVIFDRRLMGQKIDDALKGMDAKSQARVMELMAKINEKTPVAVILKNADGTFDLTMTSQISDIKFIGIVSKMLAALVDRLDKKIDAEMKTQDGEKGPEPQPPRPEPPRIIH